MSARDSEAVERLLPLKPVVFHILLVLAEADAHGYAIIQGVRQASEGRIHLTTGPFYRHLARLMDEGLVEETADRPEDDDPRRGAYYRLTDLGRRALSAESLRLASLLGTSARLGLLPGAGRP